MSPRVSLFISRIVIQIQGSAVPYGEHESVEARPELPEGSPKENTLTEVTVSKPPTYDTSAGGWLFEKYSSRMLTGLAGKMDCILLSHQGERHKDTYSKMYIASEHNLSLENVT